MRQGYQKGTVEGGRALAQAPGSNSKGHIGGLQGGWTVCSDQPAGSSDLPAKADGANSSPGLSWREARPRMVVT